MLLPGYSGWIVGNYLLALTLKILVSLCYLSICCTEMYYAKMLICSAAKCPEKLLACCYAVARVFWVVCRQLLTWPYSQVTSFIMLFEYLLYRKVLCKDANLFSC